MLKTLSILVGIFLSVGLASRATNAQIQTQNQINETTVILQQAKLCLTKTANSGKYDALKLHTNLDDPKLINGAMATDERYATREEAVLIKQRHEELEPCKRKLFDGLASIYPDLQLVLINIEIEGKRNTKSLIERKITWGQFNQNLLKLAKQSQTDIQPVIQRIQDKIALGK